MSQIICPECHGAFDGEIYPKCPSCLSKLWSNTPGFVKPKHDPYQLPDPRSYFRTVLSFELVNNLQQFAGSAAHMGTWYYSKRHHKYCHVTEFPIHTIPGSAVFEGDPMPTVAFNGLMVANPLNDPHAYCVDIQEFQIEIASGDFEKLPCCSQSGCHNFSKPGSDKCQEHDNVP